VAKSVPVGIDISGMDPNPCVKGLMILPHIFYSNEQKTFEVSYGIAEGFNFF